MTGPTRHRQVAVSIDALMHQWARQEGASAGSSLVVDAEIAARTRGGAVWPSSDALAVAVLARPEALEPGAEHLAWLAAGIGAASAVEQLTGQRHACLWPDAVVPSGSDGPQSPLPSLPAPPADGARIVTTASSQLGPGRVDYSILVIRISEPGYLGPRDEVASVLADHLQRAAGELDRPEALVSSYRARCASIGRVLAMSLSPSGSIRGTARSIDGQGAIVIETATGMRERVTVPSVGAYTLLDAD